MSLVEELMRLERILQRYHLYPNHKILEKIGTAYRLRFASHIEWSCTTRSIRLLLLVKDGEKKRFPAPPSLYCSKLCIIE